jgi:Tol biopolymer transport system component
MMPEWSPDGSSIAFVFKRQPDPDRTANWHPYVMEPAPGATAWEIGSE